MKALKEGNIDTRPLFPPMHLQPIYNTGKSLPTAESLSDRGLSLPSSVNLLTEDIERTIETIRRINKP